MIVANSVNLITEYYFDQGDHLLEERKKSASGNGYREIFYQYDNLDRVTRKIVQRNTNAGITVEDNSVFSYDSLLDSQNIAAATNGVDSLSFTHETAPPFAVSQYSVSATSSANPLGLLQGLFSINRDVTGAIASITSNGTTIFSRTFDQAGRMLGVTAGAIQTSISYDGFGRKVSVQNSDGNSGTFARDLLDRVTAVQWSGATPVSEYLQYDLAGNITNLKRENGAYQIAYDSVDQLVSSTSSGTSSFVPYNLTLTYDNLGNHLNSSLAGNGNFVSNFLLSNGVCTYQADPDGFGDTIRETCGSVMKNYFYRSDDRMVGFQSGNTQVAYYLDPFGRRVAKVVNLGGTSFTQSYLHLAEENRVLLAKGGDGSVTTYADGLGVDEHLAEVKGSAVKGYVTDHLGSILNGDAAGSSHAFGLFGESTANLSLSQTSSPVNYGYAGYELDVASSKYLNGPRAYNPNTGTWGTMDPIGLAGKNVYSYVENNPLKYTDPSGLSFFPTETEKEAALLKKCKSLETQMCDACVLGATGNTCGNVSIKLEKCILELYKKYGVCLGEGKYPKLCTASKPPSPPSE